MHDPKHMYWDSCVLIRYLTADPPEYVADIDAYIRDAMKGRRQIHLSTVAFAEIRPRHLKRKGYASLNEFFEDLKGAFSPVEPSPDVMMAAGELRDEKVTNPSDAKAEPRSVGLGDAIHLMTCINLRDVWGMPDIAFHTFDKGKGKNWEGRCVPLLGFERWFPNPAANSRSGEVCGLLRCEPAYPQQQFAFGSPR